MHIDGQSSKSLVKSVESLMHRMQCHQERPHPVNDCLLCAGMLSAIPDDSMSQVGRAPSLAAIPGMIRSFPGLLRDRGGLECAPMNALKYSAANTTAVPNLNMTVKICTCFLTRYENKKRRTANYLLYFLHALAAGDAHHWPGDSGLAKSALETRMDRNCRVVITAAKSRAPNFLIVCNMNSCPAQASAIQIEKEPPEQRMQHDDSLRSRCRKSVCAKCALTYCCRKRKDKD